MMKICHCYKDSLLWWNFFNLMTIHQNDANSSWWWKVIIVMRIHSLMKISQLDEMHHWEENGSYCWMPWLRWKFILVMKLYILMRILQYYENSKFWWKFNIVTADYQCDENASFWWRFIIMLKIHHFHEN